MTCVVTMIGEDITSFSYNNNRAAEKNAATAAMNKVIHDSILPDRLVSASSSRYPGKERQAQRKPASKINGMIKVLGANTPEVNKVNRLKSPNKPSPSPAPIDIPLV